MRHVSAANSVGSLSGVFAVLFNRFVPRCLQSGGSETSSLLFLLRVLLLKLPCRLSRFYLCCTGFNPKIRICPFLSLQTVKLRPSDNLGLTLFAGPNPYFQSMRKEFSNIHVKACVCGGKKKKKNVLSSKLQVPRASPHLGKN